MAGRRRARMLPKRAPGPAAFAAVLSALVANGSPAGGAPYRSFHSTSPTAQQPSSWFGRSTEAAVAFDLSWSRNRITHFMLLPPTGTTDRRLCPGLPLISLTDVNAKLHGGRIVHHGHQGLTGRLRGSDAHGKFTLGRCTLHWSANLVQRAPQPRDGKWTGVLSTGGKVSLIVVGGGELIKPINGGSTPMFGGDFGSCAGLTFAGALISPTGSFTLGLRDQRPPPLGARGSGTFSTSRSVSGTVQGTQSCASPKFTWTAHR